MRSKPVSIVVINTHNKHDKVTYPEVIAEQERRKRYTKRPQREVYESDED
jgi:hypothetical protein